MILIHKSQNKLTGFKIYPRLIDSYELFHTFEIHSLNFRSTNHLMKCFRELWEPDRRISKQSGRMIKLKRRLVIFLLQILSFTFVMQAQVKYPKREMRAVWVATVRNIDWPSKAGLTADEQKKELINLLEVHRENGMNAIVFQVRPACDAFYNSSFEPWAQWITGIQGQAPEPFYDPLEMIIEECHKRNMELHAWFNPYRAVVGYEDAILDSSHISVTHPEMVLSYGKNKYLNPGLPETRTYVTKVVADVVSRYDIDAVHMDDYFYPYKLPGIDFPDKEAFQKYPGKFSKEEKEDWRRNNVDLVIKRIQDTIKTLKPWVKFGISPFGVWRNKSTDPLGSDTQAKQTNYDDLYADILKWLREGWIDYVTPQAYWHIGFEIADHQKISEWWDTNSYNKNLYIGLGVHRLNKESKYKEWRSRKQIVKQVKLSHSLPNVSGNFYFSSKVFIKNPLRINQILRKKIYPYPALIPVNPAIPGKAPPHPVKLSVTSSRDSVFIRWNQNIPLDNNGYFVVYRYKHYKEINRDDPSAILLVTNKPEISLKKRFFIFRKKYWFMFTSVSRTHYESGPGKIVEVKY